MRAGETVGHFEIVEPLGKGGFGEVYKARDVLLDRTVALKLIPAEMAGDTERRERLKREARAASALNHPNVCTVYELAEFAGGLYIAMELVDGRPLRQMIGEGRPSVRQALRIGTEIAAALAEAHEHHIIHRDITAANVMLTSTGQVKIVDFGLATAAHGWIAGAVKLDSFVTLPGTALGTVGYMAPEQLLGRPVTPTSDLFSFGVVLYELVTGRRPFAGNSTFEVADRVLHHPPDAAPLDDPGIPPALRRLLLKMLAKAAEDRPASARAVLEELTEILGQLGPASGSVTSSRSRRDGASSVAGLRSIAVLPFANMSGDAENEYFSDGLAEDLTTALASVEGLNVAARTSAFAFKGQNRDIREIGARLNVETVLEGSVRRSGNRLRITAQLIGTADGYHLWSQRYDREMSDVFAIQDEIAWTIAETLEARLVGRERGLIKRYTDDVEAYNLYLKGRYYWNRRYEGMIQKALENFNEALARAPEYALAYSGVADCFNILAFYTYLPPRDGFLRAKAAAERALAIDEALPEAHTSLGLVRTFFDWDFQEGEREFRRAIQLNPTYGTAHYWYAALEMAVGRTAESLASMKRACEAEPLSPSFSGAVALMSYYARRYDEAVDAARRTLELDPQFGPAYSFLGWIYTQTGRYDEAIAAWEHASAVFRAVSAVTASLARTYALAGRRADALGLLQELENARAHRFVSSYHVAGVHLALGQPGEALAWLERALDDRSNWLSFLRVDPVFDSLRDHPSFKAVDSRVFAVSP